MPYLQTNLDKKGFTRSFDIRELTAHETALLLALVRKQLNEPIKDCPQARMDRVEIERLAFILAPIHNISQLTHDLIRYEPD